MTDTEKADASKIHSEINQILNQRYNFISIAITLFGFFIASFNFKDKLHFSNSQIDNGFFITAIFLFIFSILNYFVCILTRQFHTLRVYLSVYKLSDWESNYSEYVKLNPSFTYSKSLRFIFWLLGLLMICISFYDQYSIMLFKLEKDSHYFGPICYLIMMVVFTFIIFILCDKISKNIDEDKIRSKWESIKN